MDARRALSTAGLSATAVVAAAVGGATWYYANRLLEPPAALWPPQPLDRDLVVVEAVRPGTVELSGPGGPRRGTWGLRTADAYARVGDPLGAAGDRVERPLELVTGDLRPGDDGHLDLFAYPDDPATVGVAWEDVEVESPVGRLPAWWFPAPARTAVIVAHGRQSRRHEAFRLVPPLHRLGLPVLAISYRNDLDAPPSADHRSHLGASEWEDLEAAVRWAVSRRVDDVVLLGYSLGGSLALNLLRRSPLAERVRAVILDAPVLVWAPTIRRAARHQGVPSAVAAILLPASMALAAARVGIDWDELNHLDDPAAFRVPKLLIHGDDDEMVPVELADALAEARPDIVTYLRVPGAGHSRSWNVDPVRYEAVVAEFLSQVLGLAGGSATSS